MQLFVHLYSVLVIYGVAVSEFVVELFAVEFP